MVFIIGITLAFFLEFLLLSKPNKSSADKILAIWLLVIGIHLFLFYLRFDEKYSLIPFLTGLDIPFPLLHGPFLYLYVAVITNQQPKFTSLKYLHFIPFLVSLSIISPFLLLPIDLKEQTFKNEGQGYEKFMLIHLITILLSGFIYFSWSLVLLRNHRRKIGNYFSNKEKINLNWLRYLIYSIGTIWLVVAFLDELFIFGSVVVFVLLIGFVGIKQTQIFSSRMGSIVRDNDKENSGNQQNEKTNKYGNSGVTDELSERIYNDLISIMNDKAIYKDNNISLISLAGMLKTRPNYLSQIINEKTGNNFYNFINNWRIKEFKRLIALPENSKEKILSIAFDCGFNSKSSFHKYFKQATGQTPTEYLNTLKSTDY
jgi:AraC-like DNA-binding protein